MTKSKLTINERIANLNEEVEWFYSDEFSLDQAVEKYRTTLQHAKDIQTDLDTIKNQIIQIEQDFSSEQS